MSPTAPAHPPSERPLAPQEQALRDVQGELYSRRMQNELKRALPEHISVERFQRVVVTAVNQNPDLVLAERRSLYTACVACAQDGLLPNGKEAALVVYNTKVRGEKGQQDRWEQRVQYLPMITGIHKLVRNSGEVVMLDAQVVCRGDSFDYGLGLDPHLVHKPALAGRGEVVAVYAVAKLRDGTPCIEVMSRDEIEAVRAASRAAQNGPWVNWWGEMARKTVIRRLAKRLPLSSDLERAIQRVDALYEFDERRALPPPDRPRPTRDDFQTPGETPYTAPPAAAPAADTPEAPTAPAADPGADDGAVPDDGRYQLTDQFGEPGERLPAEAFAASVCDTLRRLQGYPREADAFFEHNEEEIERLRARAGNAPLAEIYEIRNHAKLAAETPGPGAAP